MELDSTAVSAAAPSNSDHSAVRAAHIDDEAPVKEAAGGCLPRPAETHSQAAQDGGRDPSTTLPQGSVVGRSPPAPPSPTTAHCPHTAHKQASTFTAASTAPAMDGSRSSAGEGHHSGMRLPHGPGRRRRGGLQHGRPASSGRRRPRSATRCPSAAQLLGRRGPSDHGQAAAGEGGTAPPCSRSARRRCWT